MKDNQKEELHCHYSDLPSPMAYAQTCADYDSMGNHGRIPANRAKPKEGMLHRLSHWMKEKTK